ncbi:MAG: CBASS cGAMP-activated phospholipase [Caldilineaceae bacterium]|nr:CBASS cGAMP-activated phospholipase [Caldilineaceae bacterium]
MGSNDVFNILALDGGGIRGVYGAHILAKLENTLGAPIRERFNLIAGTSTGSILAGAASMKIPMEALLGLFESQAHRIFSRRKFSVFACIRSRYSTHSLDRVIGDCLPDVTMGEVPSPLMIASSDISTGGVHVFKSRYLKDLGEPYMRDGNVRLRDAILASCAAPTYFDPRQVGQYLLADGGLWANNPTIIAIIEALSKFRHPLDKIRVLSIGTGHSASFFAQSRVWGLMTGWGGRKLVPYMLGLQSQASTNMAKLLLGDRHLRLDPEIKFWALDDIKHLQTMQALADRDFSHCSKAILANLEASE